MNAGDVVRLKSGGPKMTVTSLAEDDLVNVTWFETFTSGRTMCEDNNDYGSLRVNTFKAASLELVK